MIPDIERIVGWFGAGLFIGMLGWGLSRISTFYTRIAK